MPSKIDIAIKRIALASVAAAILGVVILFVYIFQTQSFPSQQFSTSFVLNLICVIAILLLIGGCAAIFRSMLSMRVQSPQGAAAALIEAANSLPAAGEIFNANSVLYVAWTVDYSRSLNLNRRWVFLTPRVWLGNIVWGVLFAVVSPTYFPHPSYPILVWGAMFLLGVMTAVLVRMGNIAGELRKTFGPATQIQNYALVVNPDGIALIFGNTKLDFPWSDVGQTWEATGIVLYKRKKSKSIGLIPDYAFRSKSDAKAFVATVNALKKGQTPPEYDWSTYIPVDHTPTDVWPPAPIP